MAMFAAQRIGLTKANSMCSRGTTGKLYGLAELAPPFLNASPESKELASYLASSRFTNR
jgi:hypothetical protein